MAFSHLRTNETRAIGRRREREDRRLLMSSTVQHHFLLQSAAEWEEKTNKKMESTNMKNIKRGMEGDYQQQLAIRREKLRQLLREDDETYREEIANLQESSADRARRLISHARQLKEERERKRLDSVAAAYDKQWKLACDDLRTIDSEYYTIHCKDEVSKQIAEKSERHKDKKEEEGRWAELWEADRQEKLRSEEAKAAQRRTAIIENRRALKAQVNEREEDWSAEHKKTEEEKERFNGLLASQAEALRAKQGEELQRKRALCRDVVQFNERLLDWRKSEDKKREELQRKRALCRDVVQFNERLLDWRKSEDKKRKEEERAWIEEKQKEYEADTQRHKSDVEAAQKDMRDYLSYLQEKKKEEARMESVMDALIAEEVQKENLKRDLQQQKEHLARQRLMSEVYESRQRQLEEKAERQEQSEVERLQEKRVHLLELRKVREEEDRELKAEREEKEKRKYELEAQMATLKMRKQLEELSRLRDREAAVQQEMIYRQRLERAKLQTVQDAKKNYGVAGTLATHSAALGGGGSVRNDFVSGIHGGGGRMNF